MVRQAIRYSPRRSAAAASACLPPMSLHSKGSWHYLPTFFAPFSWSRRSVQVGPSKGNSRAAAWPIGVNLAPLGAQIWTQVHFSLLRRNRLKNSAGLNSQAPPLATIIEKIVLRRIMGDSVLRLTHSRLTGDVGSQRQNGIPHMSATRKIWSDGPKSKNPFGRSQSYSFYSCVVPAKVVRTSGPQSVATACPFVRRPRQRAAAAP